MMLPTRRMVGPIVSSNVRRSTAAWIVATLICVLCQYPVRASEQGKAKESSAVTPLRLKGIDLDGKLHYLGDGNKIVVLVFLSTDCPISNSFVPRLNGLSARQPHKDVEFYGVISDSSITRADAAKHRKDYKIRFPVLFDASGDLRKALRPTHVPQAFVLGRDRTIAYSGLIDDQYADLGVRRAQVRHHYLTNAVSAVLAGREPSPAKTVPVGCLIEPDDGKAGPETVTYSRDIAPIIQTHCACCHRPGEAAPFALLTYDDVRKRAQQLAVVTHRRLMPPWKPASHFGQFREDRSLSTREIHLFQVWTKNGKPKGDPADLPPKRKFPTGWQLGKPDLIIKMAEAYSVPAQGSDILRHFVIPTGLTRDRLVAAMEFRPGNSRVVHHAAIFFDNTGIARRLDATDVGYGYTRFGGVGFPASGSLGNWLPGSTPRKLPRGTGRPMPRGSDLIMQLHYQCTGKPETDQSTVGIYFAPRTARQMVAEIQVFNTKLKIAPGTKRHHHRASYTLPAELKVFDVAPHMHLLGREMKVTATLPDGTVEPLVWVKDWDFNWQGQYLYDKPKVLPAGTRIDVDAWLDNSAANPRNPNSPPKIVEWGEQTTDEMPLCQFRYTCSSLRDLLVVHKHYVRYLTAQFPAGQSPFGRPTLTP